MGWFEHGSTIVVLAPQRLSLCDNVAAGHRHPHGAAAAAAALSGWRALTRLDRARTDAEACRVVAL